MRMQDEEVNDGNGTEAAGIFDDPAAMIETATVWGLPVLKALLIIIVAWIVAAWVRRLTRSGMERARIEPTITTFTANLVRWGVLAVGAVLVLGAFGIETAAIAVVFGGLALAIGLALQGTLGNAAAGFMLLIFRPFRVGDVINAAGVMGKVVEIELFSTMIDTPDNRRMIVPNGVIFGGTIENINHHGTRRVDVNVGVAYDADIAQTRNVLLEAAKGIEEGLEDPAPAIVLTEIADSSVNWAVRVWVNAGDFWPVKDKLTERVKVALDQAGISIPFPQMDVHLQNDKAA
jgi:small conductance mechanosensitive channel